MNKIDELIREYCPEGVKFNVLGSVAGYSSTRVDASTLDTDNFVGVDNLLPEKAGKTIAKYAPNTTRLSAYEPGDILLGNIRPYLKKVWLASNSGGCSGDVLAVRINDDYRQHLQSEFLYYILSSDTFFAYNMQHSKGAKMPRGDKAALMNYNIPIPPLKVQKEIVKILDKFAQLEAELSAELFARRKQYEYYRNELLTFNDKKNVRYTTLGDIGTFTRGNGLQKKDFTESGVGCIHYGQIFTHYGTYTEKTKTFVSLETAKKARKARPGDLVIATTSENDEDVCKAVAWLGNDEIAVSSDAMIYSHNENPKYVSYIFQTQDFFKQKKKYISGTKVRRVSSQNLAKISVVLPPRDEQDRIVGILDKFDSLVNSISDGLPAEISTRRKQYEYYRTKLLTFQELRI